MTNTTLPRKVKFSDAGPATLVREIAAHSVCRYCGEPVAYFHGEYTSQYAHTLTERSRCEGTATFQIAAPIPTCPQCGGHDVTTDHTDPWADYTRCPCGWEHRMSLGD